MSTNPAEESTLTTQRIESPLAENKYQSAPGDRRPIILLIDDEQICRNSFELLFDPLHKRFRVVSCANVAEALKILSMVQVHVVVLDRHLSDEE